MAKFVYIYHKNQQNWGDRTKIINRILGDDKDIYCREASDQLIWVRGASAIQVDDFSLVTGILENETVIRSSYYSFKMLVTDNEVRLLSDSCSSRTIWYVKYKDQFIVSSSQRVIIALLGNYEQNIQSISWMLTTGSLGPGNSWDKRINHLTPSQMCILEKENLSISVSPIAADVNVVKENISEIFNDVFHHLPHYGKNVALTLSGGYDSRAVLYNLVKNKNQVKTVTWGIEGSNKIPKSDANIAQHVAKELDVEFNFLALDKNALSPQEIMARFIMHGEGRIDHISAFSDGLKFWETINKLGIDTIIRSDEAFGWIRSRTLKDVRVSLDLNKIKDYKNLERLFSKSKLPQPKWKEEFNKKKNETISGYRDRMYKAYRIPYILSALHDLMLPFVEIVNPLLHPSFLHWAGNQSDNNRSDKKKYKMYVEELLKEVPFALTPSIPEPEHLIKDKRIADVIIETLSSQTSYNLFGQEFIKELLINFKSNNETKLETTNHRIGKNLIPFGLKKILRNTILPYNLAHNRIVLRAYIVVKMSEIIRQDIS